MPLQPQENDLAASAFAPQQKAPQEPLDIADTAFSPSHMEMGDPRSWGETVADLVVDQLDPYNLALLGLSFPVGRLFFRAASKLMGTEIIGGHAIRMVPNKLTSTGLAATRGRLAPGAAVVPELAQGLGFSIPFSAPELFEEPPEGSTRAREFMASLAFNTLLDAGLVGATIPLRFIGRAKREARRTFEYSISKGATPERASADAFLAKIEMLKAHGVPDQLIGQLVKQARDGINEDSLKLLETLFKQHGPAVLQQAQALGLAPEQVSLGLKELIEDSVAKSVVADLDKMEDVVEPIVEPIVNAAGTTPVVQAAQQEMRTILEGLKKMVPSTKPVTDAERAAGFAAFGEAVKAGQKPKSPKPKLKLKKSAGAAPAAAQAAPGNLVLNTLAKNLRELVGDKRTVPLRGQIKELYASLDANTPKGVEDPLVSEIRGMIATLEERGMRAASAKKGPKK